MRELTVLCLLIRNISHDGRNPRRKEAFLARHIFFNGLSQEFYQGAFVQTTERDSKKNRKRMEEILEPQFHSDRQDLQFKIKKRSHGQLHISSSPIRPSMIKNSERPTTMKISHKVTCNPNSHDASLHLVTGRGVLSTTVSEFPAFCNISPRINSLRALPRALRHLETDLVLLGHLGGVTLERGRVGGLHWLVAFHLFRAITKISDGLCNQIQVLESDIQDATKVWLLLLSDFLMVQSSGGTCKKLTRYMIERNPALNFWKEVQNLDTTLAVP
ncbi:hypothetical protein ANN_21499 [Periplaneta americana]|uniref:Uncharacterized protein n=1 Tax=Periplaneta americana TaxID=6978 RepID=A0ABQ8SGF0_PERAM|nr:hypothetical protein ANN_21499 [Periplaneta americana]